MTYFHILYLKLNECIFYKNSVFILGALCMKNIFAVLLFNNRNRVCVHTHTHTHTHRQFHMVQVQQQIQLHRLLLVLLVVFLVFIANTTATPTNCYTAHDQNKRHPTNKQKRTVSLPTVH